MYIYIKERGVYTETIFLVFLLIIFLIFILKIVFEVRQKEALGLAEKNRQYSGNISWCNQKRVFMKVLEIGFHPPQKKKNGVGGTKSDGRWVWQRPYNNAINNPPNIATNLSSTINDTI